MRGVDVKVTYLVAGDADNDEEFGHGRVDQRDSLKREAEFNGCQNLA